MLDIEYDKDITNLKIGEPLQSYLQRHDCTTPILMCSSTGVYHYTEDDHITSHGVYAPDILCSEQIDRMAMVLNQSYSPKGDMLENWKNCSYFDRMSSRAAADFYNALLRCAGVTAEEAVEHWEHQGQLLENLAATEHLRWNAFHYCMGFRPMSEEEFQDRVAAYRVEKAQNSNTKYRIAKDMDKRTHACLIPREALDAYSAKENAITGGNRDYAENDRNLAKVLRAMKNV